MPKPKKVQIQIRDGLPVISDGRPRRKGDVVKAIKAGREEREERILPHRRRAVARKGKRLVLTKKGVPFDAAAAILSEREYMETLGTRR